MKTYRIDSHKIGLIETISGSQTIGCAPGIEWAHYITLHSWAKDYIFLYFSKTYTCTICYILLIEQKLKTSF